MKNNKTDIKNHQVTKNIEKECRTDTNDSQLLENQLCHRLYVISNAITRAYRPLLEQTNLTYPQYVVMMALWEKDNVTIGGLHKKTKVDTGCLSVMLKKMCEKNLIQLVPSDTDKRIKYVQLTAYGRNIKVLSDSEKMKLANSNMLDEAEFETLLILLDKFKQGLD